MPILNGKIQLPFLFHFIEVIPVTKDIAKKPCFWELP